MKIKNLLIIILLSLNSIVANGQHLFTQKISDKERVADRKRSEMKISGYKWMKSDSSYFYSESYNRNGQIISQYDSEFDVTIYDYNSFGKRVRAIQMVDNNPDTAWEAHYVGDTLLFKVLENYDSNYIEELYFDSLERTVKVYKRFRKAERIDSVITTYSDSGRIEIEFEKGKPTLKIIELKNSSSSTENYLRFVSNDSTFHYLTWKSTFNKDGNEVSRIQEFYESDSKTEYYTTYTNTGLEKSSTVKSNGKIDFETFYYYDNENRLIKSVYEQKGYKSETVYFYDHSGLVSKSITKTFKDGIQNKTEIFISIYEFYPDK